jgi:hypothetical protein
MTVGNDSGSFAAAGSSGEAGSSATVAKEQAKATAGTAADEGARVAGVAQGEAQKVASEAKFQTQHLLGQATSQVEEHSRAQRDRLVGTLRTLSDDLDQMAGRSEGGVARDLVREVADRARGLTSSLDAREPRDLLEDVRAYARRRPGTFLVGALLAGVVAGRLTRGAKEAQSGGGGDAPRMSAAAGTGHQGGQGYQSGHSGHSGQTYPVADATLTAPLAGDVAAGRSPYVQDTPAGASTTGADPFAPETTGTGIGDTGNRP